MVDILLVRHGEALLPWSRGHDSGLSERGRAQALAVARELSGFHDASVCSSPLLRAVETAQPLGEVRRLTPAVDGRFAEVPIENSLARRKAWLTEAMESTWEDVDTAITDWRDAAWDALLGLGGRTIIFTHFMLINAMVTRATNDPRLVCFEPDYASVTTLRLDGQGGCSLVRLGAAMS